LNTTTPTTTALFGFGLQPSGAYLYLSIADERLECKVTRNLGPILSVTSYDDGFLTFTCVSNPEEYADFYELAEVLGCLDKWSVLFAVISDVKIVNELKYREEGYYE
jgi:hypothetical protein